MKLQVSCSSEIRPAFGCRPHSQKIRKPSHIAQVALLPARTMPSSFEVPDKSATISLQNIRNSLIRQEDTIIFNLIERAQFAQNRPVYVPGAVALPENEFRGRRWSLLDYIVKETEQLHGKVRRFTSPDEHAFFPEDLPALLLPNMSYPNVLAPCAKSININNQIMHLYINEIIPDIAEAGDDFNYGSAATLDQLCLQALSKRIHYGKFVAEAKYMANPKEYQALIRSGDIEGIMERLTDRAVERKVIDRVRLKAATFGQVVPERNETPGSLKFKVQPDLLASLYEKWIIPLTKEVEVQYLMKRLEPC